MKYAQGWRKPINHSKYFLVVLIVIGGGLLYLSSATADTMLTDRGGTESVPQTTAASPVDEPPSAKDPCLLDSIICDYERPKGRTIIAEVTAYNSVSGQSDSAPCVGSGGYICGRNDVVACPRALALGTLVSIGGIRFQCLDRMALKNDGKFDIFMDKDIEGARKFGRQRLEVTILD